MSRLGMPDLGLVGADDMVANAAMLASLNRAVPVVADADTGYGGPLAVARTVCVLQELSFTYTLLPSIVYAFSIFDLQHLLYAKLHTTYYKHAS